MLEEELVHHNEQLKLVREQLTKLRSTHVNSYSYANNSATYVLIGDLAKDEHRLINTINKLERAKAGKNNFITAAIRIT